MGTGDWKRMITAIHENDLDQVKYYINEGCDPDYFHPEMLTSAVLEAIEYENIEILQCLLENGASVSPNTSFFGVRPIKIARKKGNRAIIQLLKKYK